MRHVGPRVMFVLPKIDLHFVYMSRKQGNICRNALFWPLRLAILELVSGFVSSRVWKEKVVTLCAR